MSYFEKLNYTLANEDSRIEHRLLPPRLTSLLVVAGSGARVLPLLARDPEEAVVIDVSRDQLFLAELRCGAVRALERDEFLQFLGYTAAPPGMREKWLGRLPLSQACRDYWRSGVDDWKEHGWIWLGRWESHFLRVNKMLRALLGSNIDKIFEATTLTQQVELYETHWRPRVFRAFLKVVCSDLVFNQLLYRGNFAGRDEVRTDPRAPWEIFEELFDRTFRTRLVRENFFYQMLFLGTLRYSEGLPFEAHPDIVYGASRARTRIRFVCEDLLTHTRLRPYGFYSLSDTISYWNESDAKDFLAHLHPETPEGALVVGRSFMRVPHLGVPVEWLPQPELEAEAKAMDLTGVYQFHVFKKQPQERPS